jgi:hypothetical protein
MLPTGQDERVGKPGRACLDAGTRLTPGGDGTLAGAVVEGKTGRLDLRPGEPLCLAEVELEQALIRPQGYCRFSCGPLTDEARALERARPHDIGSELGDPRDEQGHLPLSPLGKRRLPPAHETTFRVRFGLRMTDDEDLRGSHKHHHTRANSTSTAVSVSMTLAPRTSPVTPPKREASV